MNITGKKFLFLVIGLLLFTGNIPAGELVKTNTGSMLGFVFKLDGDTELHPIAGALVDLFGASETGEIVTISPIASTYTEENGSYIFPELNPGFYMARVSKAGYQMRMEIIFIQENRTLNKNFFLAPDPTPTPTPSDTCILKGTVTEDKGSSTIVSPPIAGAHIIVYKYSNLTQTGIDKSLVFRESYTDLNGFYKIPDLPYGYYTILVEAKDFFSQHTAVNLDKPEINVNFSLKRITDPTPTPTPVSGSVLHGFVVEDVGVLTIVPPPIPNALVQVFTYQDNASGLIPSDLSLIAETYTDEDGYYKLSELPYNIYYISVSAEGYYRKNIIIWINEPDVVLNFELRKNILPTPTPTPTPVPKGAVFGVVLGWDESSSTSLPLSGAIVEVINPFLDCGGKDKCIAPPVVRAVTDENGFYMMNYVPEGYWEIEARADGFLPDSEFVDIIGGEETELNFLLKPGETIKEGEIYGYVHGGIPEGMVTFIPFMTLSGAKIEVFNAPVFNTAINEPFTDLGEPIAVAYADEAGNYRVTGLENNRYYLVRASHEGYFPKYMNAIIYNVPVEVNFFLDPKPVQEPSRSVIRGRVFEKASGDTILTPLSGVLIVIQRIGNNTSSGNLPAPTIVYTDGEGKYVADNLEAGYYTIKAQTPGYYSQFRHVLLGENDVKIVHFKLTPIGDEPPPTPDTGSLSGCVSGLVPNMIDQATSPIANALVSVYRTDITAADWANIQPLFLAMTDEQGIYEIMGISPGIYLVTAEAPGYERCFHRVEITAGDETLLDFALKPVTVPIPTPKPDTGNLAGRVLGIEPEGILQPLSGATVLVFNEEVIHEETLPAPIQRSYTDEEGKFYFKNLEAGNYVVTAWAKEYKPGTRLATIEGGQTAHILFKLEQKPEATPTPVYQGAIDGHVAYEKDEKMIPVPSAQVFAVHLDSESPDMLGDLPARHTATDEFGYYRFTNLRTGRYFVAVTAQGFCPSMEQARVFSEETTTVNFILNPQDRPTTETGAIFGKVMVIDESTSSGLKPLMETSIKALRVINTLESGEVLIPAGKTVTDKSGAYTIEGLPIGTYIVIAQKYGYSHGVKTARVKSLSKTPVNFLLFPIGEYEPADPQTDLYESSFTLDAENWKTGGAPEFFLQPLAQCYEGYLRLLCSDNLNTFGFWHSPSDAIPVKTGMIYKAVFSLSSDVADLTKVPCIRIRFNSQSEQIADMVVINSKGDGALSPGPNGRIYNFYFTPPEQEYCLPEAENDLYVSFDLVNMDNSDADNASISLDWIKIESLSPENLPLGTEAISLDFSTATQGWETQFAEGFFDPPLPFSPPDVSGLILKAINNTATFGSWVSPSPLIMMKADTLYEVNWEIFSDQADSSKVPGIRIRAGDEFNRQITQKCIFSNAEGDNSPTSAGEFYSIYYVAVPEMDETGMYLAIDIVNMNSSDAAEGAIGLRGVSIKAIELE